MTRTILAVTGTDTGVGKTLVSRGLLAACRRAGRPVAPLKLIETGCARGESGLVPEDGVALARAAGSGDLDLIAPLRFELPAAPRTAARREGRRLRFSELASSVDAAHGLGPSLLLEGAGGLLVPIGDEGSFADFLTTLPRVRLLVVARDALGTLNHTLLTVEAAQRRKLSVAGVVLNATSAEPSPLEHARELRDAHPDLPVFGPLGWLPAASDETLARELERIGVTPDWAFPGAG